MPPNRRILSLWVCRLGADRVLRRIGGDPALPLAVIEDRGNTQVISSLTPGAQAAGLHPGQRLHDARTLCPDLITRLRNPHAEAAFLAALRRWAMRFSPWVGESGADGLVLDITGCAHLFGGELPMLQTVERDGARMGITLQGGIADGPGAAWALARHATSGPTPTRSGAQIDQEARATRSRAARKPTFPHTVQAITAHREARIAAPGETLSRLSPLPVAALGLPAEMTAQLDRLGLRRIGDLVAQPRAPLARRFGQALLLRLDQVLCRRPEPVTPLHQPRLLATRLTLPDPIGLEADVSAAVDRLLPRLCEMLREEGRIARTVRLEAWRCDQSMQWVAVGLAIPSSDPERIRPLLAMKLAELEAGYGIDMLRLSAPHTDPAVTTRPHGQLEATRDALKRLSRQSVTGHPPSHVAPGDLAAARTELMGRLGARIGMQGLTRLHPAASHIPEKTSIRLAAIWSTAPDTPWPAAPAGGRPLILWPPELVTAPSDDNTPFTGPPEWFRWRSRDIRRLRTGEKLRLAPEWWLDDPDWRSGTRDYWRTTLATGEQIWLYHAYGGTRLPGWFCQGSFA